VDYCEPLREIANILNRICVSRSGKKPGTKSLESQNEAAHANR